MKKVFLSVVIPCYNEEANLKRGVLDEVDRYLKKQKYSSEVIISDDGSVDNSLGLVEKYLKTHPRFKLLKNKHGGKPFAVRAGVNAAKGKVILFTDMDQSTPINQVEKLLPLFAKSYDVVIGSRGQARKGYSLLRRLASSVFMLIRQALILKDIVDTQCGFKAFKNKAAKDLFSKLLIFRKAKKATGWRVGAFDVELLFVAEKRDYRIKEVPVEWKDRDISITKGKTKSKFLKESEQMAREIFRVRLNDWRKMYD
ncbi:MAG TPA: glycosyltransferase [Nevskiaceae bacterium]|nr:glycosyltransferase [Nevskiaceae bacterium]